MSKKRVNRGHDWITSAILPDGSSLFVIRTSKTNAVQAGAFLSDQSSRFPDKLDDRPPLDKLLTWNTTNQDIVSQVAIELLMTTELIFNVTIEAGDDYDLSFVPNSVGGIDVLFTYPSGLVSPPPLAMRKGDTHIQYSVDGETTWIDIIAIDDLKGEQGETGLTGATGSTGATGATGSPGVDGADGVDGVDGRDGRDGISPPPLITVPEDPTDKLHQMCSVAENLSAIIVSYFKDTVQAAHDDFDNSVSVLGIIGGFAVAAVALFFTGIGVPIVLWAASSLYNFLTALYANENFDDVISAADTAFQERIVCLLYCRLKGYDSPEFTTTVRDEWLTDIAAEYPLDEGTGVDLGARFGEFVSAMPYTDLQRRAFVYSNGTSENCDLCEDCDEPPPGDIMNWHLVTSEDMIYGQVGSLGFAIEGGFVGAHIGDKYEARLTTDSFDFSALDGKRLNVYTQFYADGDYGHTAWGVHSTSFGYVWDTDSQWYSMPKSVDNTVTLDATEHLTLATTANLTDNDDTPSSRLYLSITSYNQLKITRIEIVDA